MLFIEGRQGEAGEAEVAEEVATEMLNNFSGILNLYNN